MHNILIGPTPAELKEFGTPDCVIFNAGEFPANRYTTGMTSKISVDLSLEHKEVVILGTQYAGEMKKAVFTVVNYLMPKRGLLSMHCSATVDPHVGSSSVLFGLSGTGKATLSADPYRELIGVLRFFAQRPAATVLLEPSGSARHFVAPGHTSPHRPVAAPHETRQHVRRNMTDRADAKMPLEGSGMRRPIPCRSRWCRSEPSRPSIACARRGSGPGRRGSIREVPVPHGATAQLLGRAHAR